MVRHGGSSGAWSRAGYVTDCAMTSRCIWTLVFFIFIVNFHCTGP